MPRIEPINPEIATGRAKDLLDGVQQKLGMAPNLMRTMAQSPAVLEAYLGIIGALGRGTLPAKLREQIALAVSDANGCGYCLAAHCAVGRMVGLSEEAILDSRAGASADSKSAAALAFSRTLVDKRGWVSDEELARVRAAGFGDGEVAEIVANVAQSIFSNYFNHVAQTEVDFPPAPVAAER